MLVEVDLKIVRIHQRCSCGGNFKSNPEEKIKSAGSIIHNQFRHLCDKCDKADYFDKEYPYNEYREINPT